MNNTKKCVIYICCAFALFVVATIWPISAHASDNKTIACTDKYIVQVYSPDENPNYAKGFFCLAVSVWDYTTTCYILPFSDAELVENFVYTFSAAERLNGTTSGRYVIDEVIMGWISKYGIYATTESVVYLNPQY